MYTSAKVICKINTHAIIASLVPIYGSAFENLLTIKSLSPHMVATNGLKEVDVPLFDFDLVDDYSLMFCGSLYNRINTGRGFLFKDYRVISKHPHHSIMLENESIRLTKQLHTVYGRNIKAVADSNPHRLIIVTR